MSRQSPSCEQIGPVERIASDMQMALRQSRDPFPTVLSRETLHQQPEESSNLEYARFYAFFGFRISSTFVFREKFDQTLMCNFSAQK